ncbi:MAG: NPCBM/NEW2 domain-containing protein, partial [Sedimentisphaerales bacterium]|nr:NPCBM/NEW2 domain-containing protein [Sedimentisphaerales bacterium]
QVPRPLIKRNYFAMKFFAACAAVFFGLLVYVYYHPRPVERYVAHIDDVMNAQWSQGAVSPDNRSSLSDRGFYSLLSGYLRMQFDSGAEAVIEGPSVFRCNSANTLFLEQGKVFVKVAPGQEGFVVRTPSAKITDLGTQFGVYVRPGGLVEVQMIEGKALVEYDGGAAGKEAFVLSAQKALSIDPGTHTCETIDYDDHYFARTINSQESIIWRGESLNLADIAGGGNGFDTGTINHSIDLITGKIEGDTHVMRVPGPGKFIQTSHVPYVDGIFVPDGGEGLVQISSTGLVYQNCPDTDGQYSWDIHYGLYDVDTPSKRRSFILNDKEVSLAACPTFCLHANAGITFDLLEIRQALHGAKTHSFTAYCGIDKEVLEHEKRFRKSRTKADIAVLVDGVVVFEKKALDLSDNFIPVNIRFKEDARFLTLVSTNADNKETSYLSWVLWADPTIHLNTTSH